MGATDDIREYVQELANLRERPCYVFVSRGILPRDCVKAHLHLTGLYADGGERPALDLLIDSPGGHVHAAYSFVCRLRRQFDHIRVYIPRAAKSAATLLSLGADELVLGELAELGPLDSQMPEEQEGDRPKYKSALNRIKALEQLREYALESHDLARRVIQGQTGLKISEASKLASQFTGIVAEPLFGKIDPLKVAESERSLAVGERYARRVLTRYMSWGEDDAKELVQTLVRGYPSHAYVLNSDELEELGLPVEEASVPEGMLLDRLYGALYGSRKEMFELIEPGLEDDEDEDTQSEGTEAQARGQEDGDAEAVSEEILEEVADGSE